MKFKAVIFDMDGVLADTLPAYFEAERRTLHDAGVPVTDEFLRSYNGVPTAVMMRDALKQLGRENEAEALYAKAEEKLISTARQKLAAVEGAHETLKKLKAPGLKLAVASSSRKKFVDFVLEKLDMRKYFDAVVCFDDVKNGKPEPEIFLLAAKKLGVEPADCLVIEDSANGIEAAHRAGMKAVGFTRGGYDVSKADWKIGKLDEIEAVV